MKKVAFSLASNAVLSSDPKGDDLLVANECLHVIAKALGLKREAKRLEESIRAMRKADEMQAKFLELLVPPPAPRRAPRRDRDGDGHDGHGDGQKGAR